MRNRCPAVPLSRWIGKLLSILERGLASRRSLVVEVMQNYAVPRPLSGRPQCAMYVLPPHAPWNGGGATNPGLRAVASRTPRSKTRTPVFATGTGQINGEVICGRIPIRQSILFTPTMYYYLSRSTGSQIILKHAAFISRGRCPSSWQLFQ